MRSFLVGSLLLATLLFVECRKYTPRISYVYTVYWRYENQSGVYLSIEAYNQFGDQFEEWEVRNQAISFSPPVRHAHVVAPFFLRPNTNYVADSIVVRFENGKCLVYTEQLTYDERNIFDIERYNEYEQVAIKNPNPGGPLFNPTTFILTWTFTPEDAAQAVDCNML